MYVKLLGKMEITDGERVIRQEQFHSKKMVLLLAYLIIKADRPCTMRELSDGLWLDREIASPEGALKNLVYRARRILSQTWPKDELILTVDGGYRWNPEIPLEKDTDVLERLIEEAKHETDERQKEELFRNAAALYDGRLLADFEEPFWIVYEQTYFRNRFIDAILPLADMLESQGRYEELHQVCRDALRVEPDENMISRYLVRKGASSIPMDNDVLGDLDEHMPRKGALCCEPGTFGNLYQMQLYRKKRDGTPTVLVRMRTQEREKQDGIWDIIRYNIRIGDALTKSSDGQYMFMLYGCRYRDAGMVIDRIKNCYQGQYGMPMRDVKYEAFAI